MRPIPWILIGMLALNVSCGGDDEPSNDPRPRVADEDEDEDEHEEEHEEEEEEARRRKPDSSIERTDDSGLRKRDGGSEPAYDVCEVSDGASACQQCIGGECCAEMERCSGDTECSAVTRCIAACKTGDSACVSECRADHPRGIAPMEAVFSCMQTNCSTVCR